MLKTLNKILLIIWYILHTKYYGHIFSLKIAHKFLANHKKLIFKKKKHNYMRLNNAKTAIEAGAVYVEYLLKIPKILVGNNTVKLFG